MIRHIAASFILAAAVATPAFAAAGDAPATKPAPVAAIPGKIGYVDMEKLFQNYYKTFRDDAAFKKQKDLFTQFIADQGTKLELMKKQIREAREKSLNIAISDDARRQAARDADDREREAEAKERELRRPVQEKNDELGAKYMDLRNNIVKELMAYVSDFAARNRYELVLDSSGLTRNAIPAVIYYDKTKDVTDSLLTELNKGHEEEVKQALEADKKARAAAETAAKDRATKP